MREVRRVEGDLSANAAPDSAGQGDPLELPRLNEAVFFVSEPPQMIFTSSVTGPGPAVVDPLAAQRAAYIAALEYELADLERDGNPRAEQVRDELARVRSRRLSTA